MTAPDLHPEELLDRAFQGVLTADERGRLDAHLTACPVCRFEQQARQDFREAPVSSTLSVDSLVARALAGLPTPVSAGAAPVSSLRARGRGFRLAVAIAAALGAMASFAAVAQVTGLLPRVVAAVLGRPAPEPAPVVVPAPRPAVKPAPVVVPAAAAPEVDVAPVPVTTSPAAAVAPVRVAPPGLVRRAAEPSIPAVAQAVPEVDAATLFGQATQARVAGEVSRAMSGYRELVGRFPAAPEAQSARAVMGRLLLDRGEPESALREFDAYLERPDLGLREDILAARATALGRLGRTAEEVTAWKALLGTAPGSIHAARARARLEELDAR